MSGQHIDDRIRIAKTTGLSKCPPIRLKERDWQAQRVSARNHSDSGNLLDVTTERFRA